MDENKRNPNAPPRPEAEHRAWSIAFFSPLGCPWDLRGAPAKEIAIRTWKSLREDRIFGRAAELGFYFFFSLFPALFCAVSIFGMVVRSAHAIYDRLLGYMAVVAPHAALGLVLTTFNETAAGAGFGKITFSFLGALWSASTGISAIQDTLNDVYKISDSRSYLGARVEAIGITFVAATIIALGLGSLFGGNFMVGVLEGIFAGSAPRTLLAAAISAGAWAVAAALLILAFALIYYWAPDWQVRRWRYLTPGSAIGVTGWFAASAGLRIYLHYFNNFAITYGSLGTVIVLLTWFYITGLMLLAGGEIDSQIEAAAARRGMPAGQHQRQTHHDEAA
ncbi:MAG: YihY/virulence factor BrkB family protein [Acidobacteriota bacterium]